MNNINTIPENSNEQKATGQPPPPRYVPTITPEMKAKAERILAKKKAEAEAKAAAEKAAAVDPRTLSNDDFLDFFNKQMDPANDVEQPEPEPTNWRDLPDPDENGVGYVEANKRARARFEAMPVGELVGVALSLRSVAKRHQEDADRYYQLRRRLTNKPDDLDYKALVNALFEAQDAREEHVRSAEERKRLVELVGTGMRIRVTKPGRATVRANRKRQLAERKALLPALVALLRDVVASACNPYSDL